MASEPISALPLGSPIGSDEFPATDPTDLTEAPTGTTKKYILSDLLNYFLSALGLVTYKAVQAASPINLIATYNNGASGVGATLTNNSTQAALIVDGYTVQLNDRILVANQSTQYENGIYTVTNIGSASTNWVLTRATDYDSPSTVVQYGIIPIDYGVTYAGKALQEVGPGPFTIGVTSIIFGTYLNTFSITGTQYQVLANGTYGIPQIGSVTLTTPQDIDTTSNVTFNSVQLDSNNALLDANNNVMVNFQSIINAVNYFRFTNSATGNSVNLASIGADPDISFVLQSKGDGAFGMYSQNTTVPIQFYTGTNYQHGTYFNFANTNVNRTVTFPDASGTVAFTNNIMTWNSASSTPVTAVVQNGYIITDASTVTVNLPATMAIGDRISVVGQGAGGWIIQANTGQTIHIGNLASTSSGTVSSTNQYDSINLICIVANTTWSCVGGPQGNITLA